MKPDNKIPVPGEKLTLQGEISTISQDSRSFWCRFVRAGRVRAAGNRQSSIEILPEALSSAAEQSMFDGKAVFVDHAGWFEYPSLEKLAGVTSRSVWNSSEGAVEGEIQLNNTPTGQLMSQLVTNCLIPTEMDRMLVSPSSFIQSGRQR